MPRSIPPPAGGMAKPRLATPAASSLPFSRKFYLCARPGNRFISSSTISPPTKPRRSAISCNSIPSPVSLHATYSSWLNQVEIWFAKIEREVIARGIFTSVPDLARKLRRYINAYSANARPIRWKYSDPPAGFPLTNSLRQELVPYDVSDEASDSKWPFGPERKGLVRLKRIFSYLPSWRGSAYTRVSTSVPTL